MKPNASRCFLFTAIAAPAALILTASLAHAVTNYQGAGDDWANAANWSGAVVPSGTFNERLNFNSGTTVTFGSAQGTVAIGGTSERALAMGIGGTTAATLNITGGTLKAGTGVTGASLVGSNTANSIGILNISGGVLDLTTAGSANGRTLVIGLTSSSTSGISGTVTVSGTGLLKITGLRFNENATGPTAGGSITGVLNVNSGGTVETDSITEGTGAAQANTSSTVNLNGGLLKLTGATGISSSLDTVNVQNGGANIEVGTGVSSTSGKNLIGAGNGGLTKTGDGSLSLTSASTYTGATTISAGTLSAGKIDVSSGNSSLGNATSAVTLGSSGAQGTLSYTGNTASYTRGLTIGGAGGGRVDVTTAAQILTIETGAITGSGLFTVGGNGRTVINSAITHTGGLTKGPFLANTTALTLTNGSNSYNGVTTVQHGAIVVTANGALGSSAAGTTVTAGASLALSGGIDYSATETVTGSGTGAASVISGVLTDVQRGFIQSSGGNNTFRGNIVIDAGGVSRIGTQNGASLTLTGTITQASGSILFRPGNSAGDYVTLSNSGNSFGGNSTVFTAASAGNYAGVRLGVDNALPTALTISGETGTGAGAALDLNGFDQTLNGLAGSATLSIINSNTSTASTLTVDTLLDRTTTGTLIRGGGGLGTIDVVKDGTFTQTLSGTHTYTGTTTVSDGTLVINGNISTSSLTTVASGATLGGSGTVGALTIDGGGNLNPGTSPGTLATGTLSLANLSNLNFELNPADLTVGLGINDLVAVTGNLSLDGILNLTATSGDFLSVLSGSAWRLFNYSGTLTENPLSFGTMPSLGSGLSWDIDTATSGQVNLVVVPEPAAALLGGLGLLALLRRRR